MAILAPAVASQRKSGNMLIATKRGNAVGFVHPLVLLHGQELQNYFGNARTL
jgi:hypothetical protein